MRALALPLRRPIATAAIGVALLLVAVHAVVDLPLALAPDTAEPELVVRVAWPNASPEAMEALVTSRIEAEAARLRGVREVASTSGVGWGEIVIVFARGTRMDRAEVFLRERLAALRDALPPAVATPEIAALGRDDTERFLILRAGGPHSAEALRRLLQDRLVPRLAAVTGIAAVQVYGGGEREIHVDLDATRAAQGRIDATRVAAVLDDIGSAQSAGAVVERGTRLPVVQERDTVRAAALRDRAVGGDPQLPLRLRDVARVRDGWDEPTRLARIDGEPAVQVVLERAAGTNVLRVARRVRHTLAACATELPPGVRIDVVYDQSARIATELAALGRRAGWCALAVCAALWVSLRRPRAPIAVLLSVGGAAVLTFTAFRLAGLGIDLVTLSGLALAFGMSVDSSIVLLQSIAQHAGAGARMPRLLAAVRQVLLPLWAGTLTTAVVMVPFLYVTGDLRTFYLPFVLAVAMALAASFVTGIVLTPLLSRFALAGRVLPVPSAHLPAVERVYAPVLGAVLRYPLFAITAAALLLGGALWLFHTQVGRGSLFGGDADTALRVSIALPRGAEVEQVDALVRRFESPLLAHPFRQRGFIEHVQCFVAGERGFLTARLSPTVALSAVPATLQQELVTIAATISGAEVAVTGHGPGFSSNRAQTTPSYQLTLRGADYVELGRLAADIGRRLRREPRVRDIDINASDWTVEGATELVLVPSRARLARLGVPMRDWVATLQPAIAGQLADRRLEGADGEVVARVRYEDGRAPSREALLATAHRNDTGVTLRAGDVATLGERPVVPEIRRRRQQYERIVTFDYRGPRPVANTFVRSFLAGTRLPAGYTLEDGLGVFTTRKEERELGLALALALLLVYMVGAALFESWVLPFVALLGVPLGFIGVALAFWITGQAFDRAAYVGLILLAGIAINSALLLVHRAGVLWRRGQDRHAAMRRAALERCRPIALTTVTHVAGLAPLAFAADTGGTDTWRGLALAACSGLATAAVATLVVVPALFVVLAPRARRDAAIPSVPKRKDRVPCPATSAS
jgi:multidrug efflux pump subunit AcrB